MASKGVLPNEMSGGTTYQSKRQPEVMQQSIVNVRVSHCTILMSRYSNSSCDYEDENKGNQRRFKLEREKPEDDLPSKKPTDCKPAVLMVL